MKKLLLAPLLFLAINATAQFSAYDPFDDNSSEWITRNDDTASFEVKGGKLDMNIKRNGDYVNAKGAKINQEKIFRAEISVEFKSGADTVPYGLCWGASDLDNLYLFYITASGKFGFRKMENSKWKEIVLPSSSPAINKKGENWLRMNMFVDVDGHKKINFCINEEIVKTTDAVFPFGNYFGAFVGGADHILFDDFIVYQRGAAQEEFEPCDLSLSLSCKAGQLQYINPFYHWSCCIEKGCRVDMDSTVTRFWYADSRIEDYSLYAVPFPSTGNVTFSKAAEQDFRDYMAEGDSILEIKKEAITVTSMGNEAKVYMIGEVYSSYDLQGNLYLRRYYVDHPFGSEKGLVFQFITSENSPYIPLLDQLVKQVIGTMEFR